MGDYVVFRIKRVATIGKVKAGTVLEVPSPSENVLSNQYIRHALREAGYKDDDWGATSGSDSTTGIGNGWSGWEVVAKGLDAFNKRVQELEKYSNPVFSESFQNQSEVQATNRKTKESKSKKEGKSGYWSACRNTLGAMFWVLSPILFVLWLPFVIIKFVFKLLWKIIKLALIIASFGLLSRILNGDD